MAAATPVIRRRRPTRKECYQREFVQALPRLRAHAEVFVRFVRCVHRREEHIAETVALTWKWWGRLRARGKNPNEFVSAIAGYAVRAARSGRRLCGHEKAKDVMSPVAQRNCGLCVNSLPTCSTLNGNSFDEALCDNTRTPVDEQVAFRFDFPPGSARTPTATGASSPT